MSLSTECAAALLSFRYASICLIYVTLLYFTCNKYFNWIFCQKRLILVATALPTSCSSRDLDGRSEKSNGYNTEIEIIDVYWSGYQKKRNINSLKFCHVFCLHCHSGKNYIKAWWTAFWMYLKRCERDCIRAATAFDNT